MEQTFSLIAVFLAGILSFLSPCLLPLIPSYLSFIGGIGGLEKERKPNQQVIAAVFFFILGFSTVFIVISILLSRMMLFFKGIISIVAGIIIILMGLQAVFNIFKFLNYEKRFQMTKGPISFAGCWLVGAAFGAGWTPCIGPVLSGVLLIAGYDGEIFKAAGYLALYSLGLGLPFLLSAVFFQAFIAKLSKLKKFAPFIPKISGCILIIFGVFILSGRFSSLNSFFQQKISRFIQWAESGKTSVRIIPALFFLFSAGISLWICLKRKKAVLSAVIAGAIFLVCAVLQVTGTLDAAGLIAKLILYQQSV